MDVEWRDLSVTLGQKEILQPCSGSLKRGRMLALMGPSGSGKTTFLSCLRQDVPHVGDVRFAGERFHAGLRQLIGFVEQDDIVLPQLTVRQSLMFLAELRFGIGSAEAAARVEEVVATVSLGRVVESRVGDGGGGERISGGERKRLCIARELLGEPQLLICDEPTSGLDSTMAEQVIRVMRSLSDIGKVSVVASIHQPSSKIFASFDDLHLLREGHTLYFGPTQSTESFFSSYGLRRDPLQSVAEYLMDLLVLDPTSSMDLEQQASSSAQEGGGGGIPAHVLSKVKRHSQTEAAKLHELPDLAVVSKSNRRKHQAPIHRQLFLLARRHYYLMIGEVFTKLNLVQNIGLMAIAGLLWVRLPFTEADVFPRWGACLWTVGTWMFFPLMAGIATFPAVKRVLEKELRVGCYSLSSFYIARTLLLLPVEFAWPTLWTTGVYWIIDLRPDLVAFLETLLLVYFSYTTFEGVGLAISASGLPPGQSSTMAILLITFFFAWTGFFVSLERVPGWIRWCADFNPFRYSVELLMQIVMQGDIEFTCDNVVSAGVVSETGEGCAQTANGTWTLSGAAALKRQGMTSDPWLCIGVIFLVLVIARVLAFALLWKDLRTAINGANRGGMNRARASAGCARGTPAMEEEEEEQAPQSGTTIGASEADDVADGKALVTARCAKHCLPWRK